jgi:hypothetical protein
MKLQMDFLCIILNLQKLPKQNYFIARFIYE